jgi:hypothetical protein
MNKLGRIAGGVALTLAVSGLAFAQNTQTPTTTTSTTTVTKTVKNPDGSYTVIEYPVGKEVIVNLTPTDMSTGAKGTARVMRMNDMTTINLDLAGLTGDATSYNLYAVDPAGAVTLLGPVSVNNGTGTLSVKTPLNQFMLVLSPDANLTTIGADTKVALRSAVPEGMAIVPTAESRPKTEAKHVAAVTTPGATPAYNAPLLGVSTFKMNAWNRMKVNFTGKLAGSRANILIRPRKDGATQIHAHFHDLMKTGLASGTRLVLWAVSPDNTFTRLGQVINTNDRNKGEIYTETALKDFGLFVTTETVNEPPQPSGPVFATIVK